MRRKYCSRDRVRISISEEKAIVNLMTHGKRGTINNVLQPFKLIFCIYTLLPFTFANKNMIPVYRLCHNIQFSRLVLPLYFIKVIAPPAR